MVFDITIGFWFMVICGRFLLKEAKIWGGRSFVSQLFNTYVWRGICTHSICTLHINTAYQHCRHTDTLTHICFCFSVSSLSFPFHRYVGKKATLLIAFALLRRNAPSLSQGNEGEEEEDEMERAERERREEEEAGKRVEEKRAEGKKRVSVPRPGDVGKERGLEDDWTEGKEGTEGKDGKDGGGEGEGEGEGEGYDYTGEAGGEGEEGTWAEAPKELVVAVQLRGARGLAKADTFGKSDPYAVLYLDGEEVGRTAVISDTHDPDWGGAGGDEGVYEVCVVSMKRDTVI